MQWPGRHFSGSNNSVAEAQTHTHADTHIFILRLNMRKHNFPLLIFSQGTDEKTKDDDDKEDSKEDEWDDFC